MFGRIREQISENPRRSRGFSPAREFSQTLPSFYQAVKAQITCFISFYKIIFRRNKEKGDLRSAYVYFNFIHQTVNSPNLEAANHIAHIIFVLHNAMKTHL